jgi:outer membrane receptor for ferrienterochelin and colicin
MPKRLAAIAAALLLVALPAFAQTNPTGTISGKVVDQQGLAVPGVVVTVQSSALQGARSATSSANGDFILPFLPPGDYTVTFELSGFKAVKQTARVAMSQTATVSATMALSGVTETVEVMGMTDADFGQKAQVSTNIKQDLVDKLPLARTFQSAALLTPGVQATGPQGAMAISGAMSYQNLFMINGVVVQDNVRSTPFNLFIEDALQETTTSTAAISAEYGRFGGGVVNAITKSGGNQFSGSFRTTFTNDKWTALTPYPNDKRSDKVNPVYEATLGGPIVRDKLWFFGATRLTKATESRTTSVTNVNYDNVRDQKRYEGKLTFSPNTKNTLKGAYSYIADAEDGNSFSTIMDRASLVNRTTPQSLLSLNYTGIVRSNFFVEAQYSARSFKFENSGAQFTDPIKGTLMLDQSRSSARYNSPTFCGVCGPESRDNQNVVVKGSYFLSTKSAGSHNLVGGIDMFDDKRKVNNHQSGSDFRVYSTSTIIQGETIYPVFDSKTFIRWTPIFEESQGNRFRTWSFYLNDAWTLNRHVSLNVGMRYDKNDGKDATGNKVVKDSAWSPRLSASFDPKGDGVWSVNASYAKYVTAIANSVGDAATAGGQPATIDFDYLGPNVNTGGPANPVSTDQALQTLWDWFNANGGTNRPIRGTPSVPGVNLKISDRLSSPNVQEFVLGLSRKLGTKGLARVDGVYRKYGDFYATRRDLSTGKVQDQFGRSFDLGIQENAAGDVLERKYRGLNAQLSYRPWEPLNLGTNYTLSKTEGNFDGETGASGPSSSGIYAYPEYFDTTWNLSSGNLSSDVRHRFRLYGTWRMPLPKGLGNFDLGGLWLYNSGSPYGAGGTVDTRPYVANPGYTTPPASVTYWFTPRDYYKTAATQRLDLSLNWAHRLGMGQSEIFFRGRMLNVTNRIELTNTVDGNCGTGGCLDATVLSNRNDSTLARFNPFTDAPVQGTNWKTGSAFGTPLSRWAYQLPRTYDFSVGVRF